MNRLIRALVLPLAVALLAAGCSTLGYKFEAPQLTIVGVEVLKLDLLQQELRVRMHVHNPNKRELPVSGISYEIEVAGDKFARGESERDFKVPAQGDADFDVTVTANAAATLLRYATSGSRSGTLEYRLVGKVSLSSGLLRTIPFEQKGRVALR